MIKIAICDDEQNFLGGAEKVLKQYLYDNGIQAQIDLFKIPSELLDTIEKGIIYDIYLLDIFMPGITGMSIAVELRNRDINSCIIFLSSSPDYALEAFGVDATHYLLKPYTKENFYTAMNKAMKCIASLQDDSIVLKVCNEYRNVLASKIIYCESEDKYQRIYCEQENILVRITVAELYQQLARVGGFYRCGRGHIINLHHIDKITKTSVVFKNNKQLTLPRSVIAGLWTAFFDYFS